MSDERPCPLCRGKGTAVAIDAIHPDGRVENPRPAVCMICDGSGAAPEERDDSDERGELVSLPVDECNEGHKP